MSILSRLTEELKLPEAQVAGALKLLEEGNTLPFIARYRKEATGGLDEEQLRRLQQEWKSLVATDERRAAILKSLAEQGLLSAELKSKVERARSTTELEDLYLPYRPKRKTRASMARGKGLEPLAQRLLAQAPGPDLERQVRPFLSQQVPDMEAALAGARDIVAEIAAETPEVRQVLRQKAMRFGRIRARKLARAEDPKSTYATYYDFSCSLAYLRPHQTLALDRGEAQKILSVGLEVEERDWRGALGAVYRAHPRSPWAAQLEQALEDSAARLLLPAIEREVRRALSGQAHQHAIETFAANLRGLLQQPPLAGHVVLGMDPGFRTGCKLAVVDPTGKVLDTGVLYLHREAEALRALKSLAGRWKISLIAIGNGTASRESEQLVARFLKSEGGSAAYLLVSEAGASVYSASPLARAELPELDVTLRGAVSIARRVQDPLAELVKIEPRSIGVGMYQHDLKPKKLDEALGAVVESVVNRVGVELNTASPALLAHVAGVGSKLAEAIVAHRDRQGPFPTRDSLKKVAGLGPKAFQQAAGFLRLRHGRNPLDTSAIHPESYRAAEKLLKLARASMASPAAERQRALDWLINSRSWSAIADEIGVGEPTLRDIVEQIVKPGRDPREDLPAPVLRQDVLSLDDLVVGQRLPGTVRNVVDFGAFVDLGVKQDGLLHRSQLPRGQQVSVGEVLEVEILDVDPGRGRISLGWIRSP